MARSIFAGRARELERMETEACDYESFRACLRDLAQVNLVTLGYRPTLGFLEHLRAGGRWPARPLHIVDVGSGYGDTLARIARWAKAYGLVVRLTGVDANPFAIRAAHEAHANLGIEWVCADVFDYAARRPDPADIIVSALFAHHLDDAALGRFLAWMEASATVGWFINDLHRHAVPYWSFAALARAARWHPFVRDDGPLSIARAFRRNDWEHALADSGIAPAAARIEWWFPFRLCVARVKDDAAAV